jgi:hypothetical protein
MYQTRLDSLRQSLTRRQFVREWPRATRGMQKRTFSAHAAMLNYFDLKKSEG